MTKQQMVGLSALMRDAFDPRLMSPVTASPADLSVCLVVFHTPLGQDVQSQSRGIQKATHQLRQVCNAAFARNKQLMRADPKSGTHPCAPWPFWAQALTSSISDQLNKLPQVVCQEVASSNPVIPS